MKNNVDYRKAYGFIGIIVSLVLILGAYVYIISRYNIGIPCMINKVFGVYCSGCGLTRACIAMLNFDFYQAFRYNALSLILIPALFVIFIFFVWENIFSRSSFISKIPITFWFVCLILVLLFGIIRNFIPALQPTNV